MKKHRRGLLLVILLVWTLGLIIGLTIHYKGITPPNTTYTLAGGFFFDYYQYVSWIKSGLLGTILLINRYTEEPHAAALFNPWFLIAGFVSRPFSLSPFTVYFLFRLTSAIIFITILFQLIRTVLPKWPQQLLAIVLLITSGSWWWIINARGTRVLGEPAEWLLKKGLTIRSLPTKSMCSARIAVRHCTAVPQKGNGSGIAPITAIEGMNIIEYR